MFLVIMELINTYASLVRVGEFSPTSNKRGNLRDKEVRAPKLAVLQSALPSLLRLMFGTGGGKFHVTRNRTPLFLSFRARNQL